MVIKKFSAPSSSEALSLVRRDLGANALILSNRSVANGVEVMAVAEMDLAQITQQVISIPRQPASSVRPDLPRSDAAEGARAKPADAWREDDFRVERTTTRVEASSVAPGELAREMRFLRSLLEGQLAGFAWNDLQRREPAKLEVMRQMLAAGFSPTLSRRMLDQLPPEYDTGKAIRWVKAALVRTIRRTSDTPSVVDTGGVYALVGPTGVGKTTTVAKLAAACALRFGPSRLALITTDNYRIGAVDQLRIYGNILGVPVFAIQTERDLQRALGELSGRHLVLIDTMGMSQRDRRVAEQVALLSGARVRRVLLLSAAAQGHSLEETVNAYRGDEVSGCILTKIDESVMLGHALDAVIRHRLPLQFIANGQRVPEDLHAANALYLVDRAFRAPAHYGPLTVDDAQWPLVMAGASAVAEERMDTMALEAARG
jgi:flagellar biosynthesis protein FlhF